MATKSKNDRTLVWSLIALGLAVGSIGYCSTFIFNFLDVDAIRSSRVIAHLTRIMQGGLLS